jgi:hypothetical protein
VKGEDRGRKVWSNLPFLGGMKLLVEAVVKVEPFICSIGLGEIVVVLDGLVWVIRKDILVD